MAMDQVTTVKRSSQADEVEAMPVDYHVTTDARIHMKVELHVMPFFFVLCTSGPSTLIGTFSFS